MATRKYISAEKKVEIVCNNDLGHESIPKLESSDSDIPMTSHLEAGFNFNTERRDQVIN